MELRQLRYFTALAETLNFSEAARRLYITQGTLSQQIMQLEGELGDKLFTRGSHKVELTEAGKEMLPLAINTINASETCRKKISDLKSVLSGELNIGLTHSFSSLFTDTVKLFVKEHPGVKLKIYYEPAMDLIEMLHRKEVDFILAFKPAQRFEDMESELLFKTKMMAVMRKSHPLADRPFIDLEDLRKQLIVLPGSGLQVRKAFERFIDIDTSEMNIVAELNDPNIIMDILQSTNMISILSSLATYYRPSLKAIPLKGIEREMNGCIHYLKGEYRKRSADIFINMLHDSAFINSMEG